MIHAAYAYTSISLTFESSISKQVKKHVFIKVEMSVFI